MPITVGLWFPMGFVFLENGFGLNVNVLANAGVEYQIPDVPVLFYFRLGLGVELGMTFGENTSFKPDFGWAVALGAMYTF